MENDKQKNRKNAILLSLCLALIFAYPTFMSAKDMVIDGTVQWTSLILTMFFGIWVLLPFAIVLFYKGDESKQRDTENKRHFSQKLIIAGAIVCGLMCFGFGIFGVYNFLTNKDIEAKDIRCIDGIISEVHVYTGGAKSYDPRTTVKLIEYPQYWFVIPHIIDKNLTNESPITLYVPIRDYQRVVENSTLTNRELHTQDEYAPFVIAYESINSCYTLSDYNEWSRRDSKWGLYVGIVCILFGLGVEIWFFWRKKKNSQSL